MYLVFVGNGNSRDSWYYKSYLRKIKFHWIKNEIIIWDKFSLHFTKLHETYGGKLNRSLSVLGMPLKSRIIGRTCLLTYLLTYEDILPIVNMKKLLPYYHRNKNKYRWLQFRFYRAIVKLRTLFLCVQYDWLKYFCKNFVGC